MFSDEDDARFMKEAIEEAKKSKMEDDRVHPRVGVVIVSADGTVLARAHRGENGSGDHAEFTGLEKKLSTNSVVGATVYTTLEPCTSRCHPKVPCAFRLLERKVRRVVIGMLDPNPEICGKGIWLLRESNVATDLFPHQLMCEVEEANREFIRAYRPPQYDSAATSVLHLSSLTSQVLPSAAIEVAPIAQAEESAFVRFIEAVEGGDFDRAESVYGDLCIELSPERQVGARVWLLVAKYRAAGNQGTLDALELMIGGSYGDFAASRLGDIYRDGNNLSEAIGFYRRAIALVPVTESRHHNLVLSLSSCLVDIGEVNAARTLLSEAYRGASTQLARAKLLEALADEKISSNPARRAAILACASQLAPGLRRLGFDAAFALSHAKFTQYALSQYAALVRLGPENAAALNNLAVECESMRLFGKAVESFTKSMAAGNTLAAANLATRYIGAGFYEQAESTLAGVRGGNDVHRNVGAVTTSVADGRIEEQKRYDEAIRAAVEHQLYVRRFVDALAATASPEAFAGKWRTPDSIDVELIREGDALVGEWGPPASSGRRRIKIAVEGRAGIVSVEKWEFYRDAYGSPDHGLVTMAEDFASAEFLLLGDGGPSITKWSSARASIESSLAGAAIDSAS